MTVQEFHIAIGLEVDKTLDFEYPYMSPEQIDYWLNKAQDRFVKQRASGNNLKKEGFEVTQKRIDDLRTVLKDSTIVPVQSGTIFKSALPADYRWLIRHTCDTGNTVCSTSTVGGQEIQQDDLNELKINPFWSPSKVEPLYYLFNNDIVYETDGNFTVTSTKVYYIKKYNKIQYGTQYVTPLPDIQCELPEFVHEEIVDIARDMILENIESQRYQTSQVDLTKSE